MLSLNCYKAVAMASEQEKAFCMLSFARNQSVITVQCEFRRKCHTNKAPISQSI